MPDEAVVSRHQVGCGNIGNSVCACHLARRASPGHAYVNVQVPPQQQRQPQRQSFGIRLEPVPATEAIRTPELHVNGFRNKTVRPRATRLTLDSEPSCYHKFGNQTVLQCTAACVV